ncbi:putative quinol monooxygenase [Streptomyces cylindrosporus]|uniref:Antibiotic biosynthesis monooxygenase n=1 Tax=Streptomyces cylindrosporus TaxID=2927583 RepID=A0ABS9YCI2_9ACTN|nr:antibiotic biosynthesis monooxygenase family protein [Streptomyces cylindrosporus]MCI3274948.1 antibiotic biosynthesis monooxygenase [Streptomyces cylindrosporus]
MTFTALSLRPAPGRRDELIAYYRSAGILEASGAIASQVLVPEDDPDTVVVTALWADDDARAAWQNSPRRLEFARGMAPFFDSADAASTRVFRVAHHHVTR